MSAQISIFKIILLLLLQVDKVQLPVLEYPVHIFSRNDQFDDTTPHIERHSQDSSF